MGFFKDFKDDFSQAVNELMPGDDSLDRMKMEDDLVVDTLGDDVDVLAELSKLDDLLGQVKSATDDVTKVEPKKEEPKKEEPKKAEVKPEEPKKEEPKKAEVKQEEPKVTTPKFEEVKPVVAEVKKEELKKEETRKEEPKRDFFKREESRKDFFKKPEMKTSEPVKAVEEPIKKAEPVENVASVAVKVQEEKRMGENTTPVMPEIKAPTSEEVSVITQGMIINGDVISNGSLDIRGEIHGNVTCNGKLTVTGTITGNSNSSEFFADSARVDGEVTSTGTVKIGLGSVVVGNVTSTSAVIAGAIKGDIDVQGPVVVDTSAVVMGNIKSRSVQINNGAVIEGFCSQVYSDVDVKGLFESKKGN